jgi:hypothetical protein
VSGIDATMRSDLSVQQEDRLRAAFADVGPPDGGH